MLYGMGSQRLANMLFHYLFSASIGVRRAEFVSILSQDAACENRKTRGENTKESTVVTANIHVRINVSKILTFPLKGINTHSQNSICGPKQ